MWTKESVDGMMTERLATELMKVGKGMEIKWGIMCKMISLG